MLIERPQGDITILINHICFKPVIADGDLEGQVAGRDTSHDRTRQKQSEGPLRDGSREAAALAGASVRGPFPAAPRGGSAPRERPRPGPTPAEG